MYLNFAALVIMRIYFILNTLFYILFLLLFFLLGVKSLNGQPSHYHQYTVEDGLASDAVYGVMQDREGYIWIYTEKGISKFDGYTFKNIQEGLPNYDVWGLTEDSQGRLWVQTFHDRLVYIYKDSICEIKTPGNHKFYIPDFHETNGEVWFYSKNETEGRGMKGEYFYIEGDTVINELLSGYGVQLSHFLLETELLDGGKFDLGYITTFKKDSVFYFNFNGELIGKYFSNTEWVEKLNNERNKRILNLGGLNFRITRNNLTVGSSTLGGVFKWNNKLRIGKGVLYDELYGAEINDLESTPIHWDSNSLQVTLMPEPGFLEVDMDFNLVDTFNTSGLNNRRVFKDRQSNYWVSTIDNGVYFVSANSRNAQTFTYKNNNRILELEGNNKGQLFISTASGEVYFLSDEKLKPLITNGAIGRNIHGLALSKEEKLFMGGENGFVKMDISNEIEKDNYRSLLDDNIQDSEKLKKWKLQNRSIIPFWWYRNAKKIEWNQRANFNELWFSNNDYVGVVDYSDRLKPKADIIFKSAIKAITFGENNEVWIGGSGGVWKIIDHESIGMQKVHENFSRNINDLEVDTNNILWAATDGYGSGVFGYRNDSIYKIPFSENAVINDLFIDEEGYLWVGTDRGLQQYEIDPNNYKEQKLVRTYTTNDGIVSREINAVFVDEKYIYVGTNKGLTRIDKFGKYKDDSPPKVYIKDIWINGEPQKIKNKFKLDHKQNELKIDFVALSYKSLGNINYEYQLEGADQGWQSTQNRTIRYPDLRPGVYTFRLKAIDISNRTGELLEPISFEIQAPIWRRTWFQLSLAILLGIIGWYAYKSRIQKIKERETKRLRYEKKVSELELRALQSQMNPHFVFNALASIRYFIQEKQTDEAGDYLARFAKLMRIFLESSKKQFVTLEDELNLIRLYVEMEQLRFEEKFKFNLIVEKSIDISITQIPTLLIQPFVENAINHGLFHKAGGGILNIKFRLVEEQLLICIIEDNGIGRVQAKKIRTQSIKGYKSRGMQIVDERLNVLEHMNGINVTIDIIDLENFKESLTGTRVTIKIPILD